VGNTEPQAGAQAAERKLPDAVGAYKVKRLLGEGGMGEVYLCSDATLDRDVAVKALLSQLAQDPEMSERFLREARAMAKVVSPHVVTIFHVVHEEGSPPHIVMELLDGEDVSQRLARGNIPWPEAIDIIVDSVKGLRAAYKVGLVHRDVKPANLFLTPDGTKLTDFGLARPMDGSADLTAAGIIVGTPHYLAPELARGGGGTVASDIYALGATLFRMLTGRPPFDEEAPLAVITRHITDPVPSFNDMEGVSGPVALDELIQKMMAKKPEDRPATYDELEQALLAIKNGETLPTAVPSSAEASVTAPISDDPTKVVSSNDVPAANAPAASVQADGPTRITHSQEVPVQAVAPSGGLPGGLSKQQLGIGAGLVLGGILLMAALSSLFGDDDRARIDKGDAAIVLKEKNKVPASKRPGNDELVRGHAFVKLEKDDKAIAAFTAAAKKGASDDDARDYLIDMMDDRNASDVIQVFKHWPDSGINKTLAALAKSGSWNQRHHALAALHARNKDHLVNQEAFGIRDLEKGKTCDGRKKGLMLLKRVGKSDKAYATVERAARRMPQNLCMMLDFDRAKRAIRKRQE